MAEFLNKVTQHLPYAELLPTKVLEILDRIRAARRGEERVKNAERRYLEARLRFIKDRVDQLDQRLRASPLVEDRERRDDLLRQAAQIGTELSALPQGPSAEVKGPVVVQQQDLETAFNTEMGRPPELETTIPVEDLYKTITQDYVFGQDAAIKKLTDLLSSRAAGTSTGVDAATGQFTKPAGPFTFIGPTGVGKTETALCLARLRYGSADALIRMDMSEFSEAHSVSRLKGASASYVGYDDTTGRLTERVRLRGGRVVILFDEIEKAHPAVFNELMNMLDTGFMDDNDGNPVDFRNAVIIFSSNFGFTQKVYDDAITPLQRKKEELRTLMEALAKRDGQGLTGLLEEGRRLLLPENNRFLSDMQTMFEKAQTPGDESKINKFKGFVINNIKQAQPGARTALTVEKWDQVEDLVRYVNLQAEIAALGQNLQKEVLDHWRSPPLESDFHIPPETIGRLGEPILFQPLGKPVLQKIVNKELAALSLMGEANAGVTLTFDNGVAALVTREGYTEADGARPIRAVIDDRIIDPLALELLRGNFPKGTVIHVRVTEGRVVFDATSPEEKEGSTKRERPVGSPPAVDFDAHLHPPPFRE